MKTPDITLAQILAAISAAASQAVALSVLDKGTAQYITQIAGIVVPSIWALTDMAIRRGRAKVVAAQTAATTTVLNSAPALTDKPAGTDVPKV